MDKEIFKNCKGVVKFGYNLAHLTWLKVGGPAEIFYKPYDLEDLQQFLQLLPKNIEINVIGAGSNLLIRDGGLQGVVIKLGSNFNYINQEEKVLKVGAATLNYSLAQFCYLNSIANFEFLVGIPGTIGGGIAMNAGAYLKEFKDILHEVTALKFDGSLIKLSNSDCGFRYRGNSIAEPIIFVEAKFKFETGDQTKIKQTMDEINAQRKLTQPIHEKTAGSTFANPKNMKAWELIDKVGMRGYTLGEAQISKLHSNFLINLGNASADNLETIAEIARTKVLQSTGIELNWEVKRIGKKLN
jgi:UDP-N-acetylmuramate dehydrogenase